MKAKLAAPQQTVSMASRLPPAWMMSLDDFVPTLNGVKPPLSNSIAAVQ